MIRRAGPRAIHSLQHVRRRYCWHINFARNEHPHQETSSWSAVPNWFRTYARITSIDFVSAGTEASPFLLAVTVEN